MMTKNTLPRQIFSKTLLLARVSRPKTLEEYVGHYHLMQPGKDLLDACHSPDLPSMIVYGPSGIGKTTIACLLARKEGYRFAELHFIDQGRLHARHKETFDEMMNEAEKEFEKTGVKTALVLDEIHRLTYHQQNRVVGLIERGVIAVVGTTVFRPEKFLIPDLVALLKPIPLMIHKPDELRTILRQVLEDNSHGLGELTVRIDPDAGELLCRSSEGSAKTMLRFLEKEVLRQMFTHRSDPSLKEKPFVCRITQGDIERLVNQRLRRKELEKNLSNEARP